MNAICMTFMSGFHFFDRVSDSMTALPFLLKNNKRNLRYIDYSHYCAWLLLLIDEINGYLKLGWFLVFVNISPHKDNLDL